MFCAELSPRTLLCLPRRLLPSGVVGLPRGIGRKYAKAAISVELDRTDRQNSNKRRGSLDSPPKLGMIGGL